MFAAEAAKADACRCASHAGYARKGVAKLTVLAGAKKEEVAQEQATTFEETLAMEHAHHVGACPRDLRRRGARLNHH